MYIAVQNLYSYFILKQGKPGRKQLSKKKQQTTCEKLENSVNCILEHM